MKAMEMFYCVNNKDIIVVHAVHVHFGSNFEACR